jgi:glycosyltransferase involved in cell wall biosynthesis
MKPQLALVIPCYNEEEVIGETISRLTSLLRAMIANDEIEANSYVLFVDDGSKDQTWNLISSYHQNNTCVKGLKLSKNVGHQNALLAGLMHVRDKCDCSISIDADLQDDITKIPDFIAKFKEGCQVVYGVRSKREKDSFFKRFTAEAFYRFMKKMGVNIIYNHADYRLLSKEVLAELGRFSETNLFLRGIVPLLGFKNDVVYYERHERFAGESKYPLKKMLSFAFNGISSFSIQPIRVVTSFGIAVSLLSVLAIIYSVIAWFFGRAATGWTSTILSIWFLGGVQILSLGLVGEYIGKIYQEVKHRPRYIIEKTLD